MRRRHEIVGLARTARSDWAAVEFVRDLPEDVLKASRAAREALDQDLLATVANSPLGGGPPSDADRERWLAIGKGRPFERLEALIAACKRM